MLIHKIFHLHQPVPEARECLRALSISSGLEKDDEVCCSRLDPEGIGRFEFKIRQGHRLSADIQEVPGNDPNRILFRSVGGDVEIAGIVELFPIRPNLTEAVLTLDYDAVTALQKALDALAATLDRFLNRQLARIETCMERARAAREERFA